MKLFYRVLFLVPFGALYARHEPAQVITIDPFTATQQPIIPGITQENKDDAVPCQCYCSDLCGPRNRKPDDTPFLDPNTGEYFCKQRDKDNYYKNQCNIKNPNPSMENTCKPR